MAVRTEFEKAKRMKKMGDLAGAEMLLARLVSEHPESAKLLCALGGVYFEAQRFENSAQQFQLACELVPTLELASLGLFHSLWSLNNRDAAEIELRRFMQVSDSQDYREIAEEIGITL